MLGCCLQRLLLHFHIYKIIESGYCQINNARQTKKATERTANMATVTQDSYVYISVCDMCECVCMCVPKDRSISLVYTSSLYCFALGWLYSLPRTLCFGIQDSTHHHHRHHHWQYRTTRISLSALLSSWKEFRPCTDFIKLHSQLFWIDSTTWNRPQQQLQQPDQELPSSLSLVWLYLPALCFLHLIFYFFTFISFYCRLWGLGVWGCLGGGTGAGCLAAKQEAAWQLLQMAGCLPLPQPLPRPRRPHPWSRHSRICRLPSLLLS